jgi:hypothetical protein
MRRRDVLVGIPPVLLAVACGGGDGAADANNQTSFQVQSETNTSGHRHNMTVVCADIGGSDVRYTTSESANHTHMVTVTGAELMMIGAGTTVTKTITDQGHSHTWILMKPSTAC